MAIVLTNEMLYQKSPQELTTLLYEACLINLEEAIIYIQNQELVNANDKLKKASDIVYRLGAGLNYEAGIVADQLDQVYNYMADRIIEANIKKDQAIIEEIIRLLTTILSSWNEAMTTKQNSQPSGRKQKVNAYESNSLYK